MPEIDLDFGAVGKVPVGWFRLTVDKAVYRQNRAGTGMVLNLQMHFTDMPAGDLPGTEVPYEAFEGNPVYDSPSTGPASRWKLANILSAITQEPWEEDNMKLSYTCEEDCEDFREHEKCPHTKVVPSLAEATVIAYVVSDDYTGSPQPKPQKYLADDGSVTEFGADGVTE
jgi:hypothetical protein